MKGVKNMKKIQMLDLYSEYKYMKKDIDEAISKCMEHQKWILGPEVEMLEKEIAKYTGVKYCVGISSGTDALVLALRALAIKLYGAEYFKKDQEIITTAFTFTATGDSIVRSGATPVFVDVDPNTYNIDPGKIRNYLESKDTTFVIGILPVHLYGRSCQMDEIMEIANEYNLFVLEDVAQAFGAKWKEKRLGSIGNAGTFSFFPSKNLGGFGDGGMVATNDTEIEELVRVLVKHGGKDKYNVDYVGYNARLDTLQAAILIAKLKYVNEFNESRRHIAEMYSDALDGVGDISIPVQRSLSNNEDFYHVYHQYTICTSTRNELKDYLNQNNISSMIYYPYPLHKMKVFGNSRCKVIGNLDNTEKMCDKVLSLPIEPLQSTEDTKYIIGTIKGYFK